MYEMNVTTQTRPFCHDTYAGENTGCEPCTPPSILGAVSSSYRTTTKHQTPADGRQLIEHSGAISHER